MDWVYVVCLNERYLLGLVFGSESGKGVSETREQRSAPSLAIYSRLVVSSRVSNTKLAKIIYELNSYKFE